MKRVDLIWGYENDMEDKPLPLWPQSESDPHLPDLCVEVCGEAPFTGLPASWERILRKLAILDRQRLKSALPMSQLRVSGARAGSHSDLCVTTVKN